VRAETLRASQGLPNRMAGNPTSRQGRGEWGTLLVVVGIGGEWGRM